MSGTTLDLEGIMTEDQLAIGLAKEFLRYNTLRQTWLESRQELRNYVFATDTRTTSNAQLPWKNSTTLPKLCQIRDNLHANYMAALFPHSDWLQWEGDSEEAEYKEKRQIIQSYMKNKLEQQRFKSTVSQLVYDYIDYGNMFCSVAWVNETKQDELTGETIKGYVGPKLVRISPTDIVFNPAAPDFKSSPKFVREIKNVGEIVRYAEETQDADAKELAKYAVERSANLRRQIASTDQAQEIVSERLRVDGFSSLHEYLTSGYVEVITFMGDYYDIDSDTLYKDHIIKVIDQSFILTMKQNPAWVSNNLVHHVGWRVRQDNLYAMGPLDNLVGMQYRIDHLENLKADVFDLIAHPVLKIRGDVQDFDYGPTARIYTGDEGDVTFMSPDVTALNADTQISILEQKMEEMAGAPREAMGFRTAGEKTAYEVQRLETASTRIFNSKTAHFETEGLEPALNNMLELARRNMSEEEKIRTFDEESGAVLFDTITKEDITTSGQLKAKGAQNFARKAQIVQNITNLMTTVGADPAVNRHISGLKLAEQLEELLDLEKQNIVRPNVRLEEEANAERFASTLQDQLAQEQGVADVDQQNAQRLAEIG